MCVTVERKRKAKLFTGSRVQLDEQSFPLTRVGTIYKLYRNA